MAQVDPQVPQPAQPPPPPVVVGGITAALEPLNQLFAAVPKGGHAEHLREARQRESIKESLDTIRLLNSGFRAVVDGPKSEAAYTRAFRSFMLHLGSKPCALLVRHGPSDFDDRAFVAQCFAECDKLPVGPNF